MPKGIGKAFAFFSALAVLSLFSSLWAEESEEKDIFQELDLYSHYQPMTKIKKVDKGEVGLVKSGFNYDYSFKAFGKLPIKLSLINQYIGINEEAVRVLLPAHLVEMAFDAQTTLPFFFRNTYFRIGVEPSFYGEDWTMPASSFRIPSYYILIYRPNPKLILLCGLWVAPDFENVLLPIPGIIYKPNDRLIFNLAPRNPNITYALTKKLSIFAEGNLALDKDFEVTRDGTKGVILSYKEAYLGLGFKYRPAQNIQLSLSEGRNFWRRLKYRDNVGKVAIRDGLYTELRVNIRL